MRSVIIVALLLQVIPISPPIAETLIACGPSDGYAYYLPQNLVPVEESGWKKDELPNGAFSLVKNGDEVDIVYKDATGVVNSSKAAGASVSLLGMSKSNLLVAVQYKNVLIELYTFDMIGKLVVWSQHKYGAPVNKVSVFRSKCD